MANKTSGSGNGSIDDNEFMPAATGFGGEVGGDDAVYDFEEMPQLGGSLLDDDVDDFAPPAQRQDEFAEDAFAPQTDTSFDFEVGSDGSDAEFTAVGGEDAFSDVSTAHTLSSEGRGPVFSRNVDEGHVEESDEVGAVVAPERSPIKKFLPMAGVSVLVVGLLAYGLPNVVFPTLGLFQDDDASPILTTSLDIPTSPPSGNFQLPGELPAFAAGANDASAPSLPGLASPSLPPVVSDMAPALPPGIGGSMSVGTNDSPVGQPVALQPSARDARVDDLADEVANLSEQLADLQRGDLAVKLAVLEKRLSELEAQPVEAITAAPLAQPPSKPVVVVGWALKGISNGVAWIEGDSGTPIEVREGVTVPGVGDVTGITTYEGGWVVKTTAGIILPN